LYHCNAKRRKYKDYCDQCRQRHHPAHWSEPCCRQRSDQKVRTTQDQIGQRKRPPKSQLVSNSSAKDRQKPNPPTELPAQSACFLRREIEVLMEIKHDHGKYRVIRKPLKDLSDVSNPEWSFKAGLDLLQAFRKGQSV